MISRVLIGFVLSSAIAAIAYRRGALSSSGALAAAAVGAVIFVGGGPWWFGALGVFFVTSTLLGRVGAAFKARTKREFSKGDTRDAWQVLANGGVAAVAALLMLVAPDARWLYAFVGALATANGDTWATELGILSPGEPRSIVSLRRVPRGSSGAVSALGLAATVAGAFAVGLAAASASGRPLRVLFVAVVAGTAGALVDSLAGATVQETFFCRGCARECESPRHHCGADAERLRGVVGFGNDLVNFTATLAGAVVGAALY
ncbi:MAG TPA: DUF92 domain-containing protein [Polyangia bacterium]